MQGLWLEYPDFQYHVRSNYDPITTLQFNIPTPRDTEQTATSDPPHQPDQVRTDNSIKHRGN